MSGMIGNLLYVGLGSCIGGIARYLVGRLLPLTSPGFPFGTLIVNLAGCFLIGLIFGLIDRNVGLSDGMRLFLTVGFCGGFTTFSTFMYDNFLFLEGDRLLLFFIYTSVSLIVGLLLVYAGYTLGGWNH